MKRPVLIPTPEEVEVIYSGSKPDPDAQPLSNEHLQAMVPLRSLRGRPRSPYKKHLGSIKYSHKVLNYSRALALAGWLGWTLHSRAT
jgi:hypothetical protein